MSRKAQDSFYLGETFDAAEVALTYTAAGLGAAKYTACVAYYSRLDLGAIGALNGFVSALWSKGSGTAPTAYLGLYQGCARGPAARATARCTRSPATANIGGDATGFISAAVAAGRVSLAQLHLYRVPPQRATPSAATIPESFTPALVVGYRVAGTVPRGRGVQQPRSLPTWWRLSSRTRQVAEAGRARSLALARP